MTTAPRPALIRLAVIVNDYTPVALQSGNAAAPCMAVQGGSDRDPDQHRLHRRRPKSGQRFTFAFVFILGIGAAWHPWRFPS